MIRLLQLGERIGTIARALNRSEKAVASKLDRLGISYGNPSNAEGVDRRSWTRSEEDTIRRNYPAMTANQIIETFRLGRTEDAVHARARLLGLCKKLVHSSEGDHAP